MTIKYDTVADAVYVGMSEAPIVRTIRLNDNLMMDVDAAGKTVGLEILDASSQEELVENIRRNAESGILVSINTSTPAIA